MSLSMSSYTSPWRPKLSQWFQQSASFTFTNCVLQGLSITFHTKQGTGKNSRRFQAVCHKVKSVCMYTLANYGIQFVKTEENSALEFLSKISILEVFLYHYINSLYCPYFLFRVQFWKKLCDWWSCCDSRMSLHPPHSSVPHTPMALPPFDGQVLVCLPQGHGLALTSALQVT